MSASDPSKLIESLESLSTCMLVTAREDVGVDARPMTIAEVDDDGTMWMLTDADTRVVDQLKGAPMAAITGQSMTTWLFASGMVAVVDDEAKAESLWKESFRVWFPEGPETSRLRVLRFSPKRAEVWDMSAKDVARFAFQAAKAYAQGTSILASAVGNHSVAVVLTDSRHARAIPTHEAPEESWPPMPSSTP